MLLDNRTREALRGMRNVNKDELKKVIIQVAPDGYVYLRRQMYGRWSSVYVKNNTSGIVRGLKQLGLVS